MLRSASHDMVKSGKLCHLWRIGLLARSNFSFALIAFSFSFTSVSGGDVHRTLEDTTFSPSPIGRVLYNDSTCYYLQMGGSCSDFASYVRKLPARPFCSLYDNQPKPVMLCCDGYEFLSFSNISIHYPFAEYAGLWLPDSYWDCGDLDYRNESRMGGGGQLVTTVLFSSEPSPSLSYRVDDGLKSYESRSAIAELFDRTGFSLWVIAVLLLLSALGLAAYVVLRDIPIAGTILRAYEANLLVGVSIDTISGFLGVRGEVFNPSPYLALTACVVVTGVLHFPLNTRTFGLAVVISFLVLMVPVRADSAPEARSLVTLLTRATAELLGYFLFSVAVFRVATVCFKFSPVIVKRPSPRCHLKEWLWRLCGMPSSDSLFLSIVNLSVFRPTMVTVNPSVAMFRAAIGLRTRLVSAWPPSLSGRINAVRYSHRGSNLLFFRVDPFNDQCEIPISCPLPSSVLVAPYVGLRINAVRVRSDEPEMRLFVVQDIHMSFHPSCSRRAFVDDSNSDLPECFITCQSVISRVVHLKDTKFLELAHDNGGDTFQIPLSAAVAAFLRYRSATHPMIGVITTALPNVDPVARGLFQVLVQSGSFNDAWRRLGPPDTSFTAMFSNVELDDARPMNVAEVCNAVYLGKSFGVGRPMICTSNELDTFARRILHPSVHFELTDPTDKLSVYAHQFLARITPPHFLVPVGHDDIVAQMDRPSQRLNRENVSTVMDYLPRHDKSMFTKNEPVEIGKPARNIVTMSPQRLYQAAAFTMAASDWMKNFKCWVWGVGSGASSRKYHAACEKYEKMIESDFSKFDASLSQFFVSFNNLFMTRLFSPEDYARWIPLADDVLYKFGVTKRGLTFPMGCGRLSGCNETTLFNTLDQWFIQYVAVRDTPGITEEKAWDVMMSSLYGGDDGVTPYVGQDLSATAASFGMVVDVRIFESDTPCRFLGRIYPCGRHSPDSYQDIASLIKELHIVPLGSLSSPEQGLVNRISGLSVTDSKTPFIRDIIASVRRAYPDLIPGFLDSDQWWLKHYMSEPEQFSLNDYGDEILILNWTARDLGVPIEDLYHLWRWFSDNAFYVGSVLPVLSSPDVVYRPAVATQVFGLPFGEPTPAEDLDKILAANGPEQLKMFKAAIDKLTSKLIVREPDLQSDVDPRRVVSFPQFRRPEKVPTSVRTPAEVAAFHDALAMGFAQSEVGAVYAAPDDDLGPPSSSSVVEATSGALVAHEGSSNAASCAESVTLHCKFCHNSRKPPHSTDHCPDLAKKICKKCRGVGHSAKFCTLSEEESAATILATSVVAATPGSTPLGQSKLRSRQRRGY